MVKEGITSTQSQPQNQMVMNSQFHNPTTLHPRKKPWYQLDRRLGGPQSQSGHCKEEKNPLPLLGIET
jgi:hypothetical protein